MGAFISILPVETEFHHLVGSNLYHCTRLHAEFNEPDPEYSFLTKAQFQAVLTDFSYRNPEEIARHFEYQPALASTPVWYYDFIVALVIIGYSNTWQKVKYLYHLFDFDKDGYIQKSEFKIMADWIMRAVYGLAKQDFDVSSATYKMQVDTAFAEMNTSGSGKISLSHVNHWFGHFDPLLHKFQAYEQADKQSHELDETFMYKGNISAQSFNYSRLRNKRPTGIQPKKTMQLSGENIKILSYVFNSLSSGEDPRVQFNKFLLEMVKNRVAKPKLLKSKVYTRNKVSFQEALTILRPYQDQLYQYFEEISTPLRAEWGDSSASVSSAENVIGTPEIAECKQIFDAYDKDHNGTLDPEEIRQAFNSIIDNNEELERLLLEFDVNGDGVIDFDEFVQMIASPDF